MFDQSLCKIKGFPAPGRAALEGKNLGSTASVWAALSQDDQLIANLGLPVPETEALRSALATQANKESRSITTNFLVRHLADMLVLAAIAALGLTFYLVHWVSPDKILVSAAKPIEPYQVILATDLAAPPGTDPKAVTEATSEYIGRYPSTQIFAGDKLNAAQLSSGRRLAKELDGLRIFSVKLRPTALLDGVKPPVQLNLFLSPHNLNDKASSQEFPVYLLDVRSRPDGVVAVVAARTDISSSLLSTQLAGDLVVVSSVQ